MGLAASSCPGGPGDLLESSSSIWDFLLDFLQTPCLLKGLLFTRSREVREEFCLFLGFVFLSLYLCHHRNRKEHVLKLWIRRNF